MKNQLTASDLAGEDWSSIEGLPMLSVECVNDHAFMAHSKFSGRLVAIISKEPCPVCGQHQLRRASSDWHAEAIRRNDIAVITATKAPTINRELIRAAMAASKALGQYEETVKRLKFTPFSQNDYKWLLLYNDGPHYFALRELMKSENFLFTVVGEPRTLTSLDHTVVVTPWSRELPGGSIKVRSYHVGRMLMPLVVEAGEWDCPQINPLFDWTVEQAWGYLLHRGVVDWEDLK